MSNLASYGLGINETEQTTQSCCNSSIDYEIDTYNIIINVTQEKITHIVEEV